MNNNREGSAQQNLVKDGMFYMQEYPENMKERDVLIIPACLNETLVLCNGNSTKFCWQSPAQEATCYPMDIASVKKTGDESTN